MNTEYNQIILEINNATQIASDTPLHPEKKLCELVEPLWERCIRVKQINLHFEPRNERALANGRADTVYNRLIIEYKKPGAIKSNNAKNRQIISQVKGYIEDLAKEERWKEERLLGLIFDGRYFLYARKLGTMINRRNQEFADQDIALIAGTYHAWRGKTGVYEDQAGFCKAVTVDEVRANNYVLMPGRYVGKEKTEDDSVPFEGKMSALTAQLAEQFAKGDELQMTIRENLKGIGYDF